MRATTCPPPNVSDCPGASGVSGDYEVEGIRSRLEPEWKAGGNGHGQWPAGYCSVTNVVRMH